jgi:hypothetical protein
MKTNQWVKIGEVVKDSVMFRNNYSTYAVLELIKENGDRKYKEVYMASDTYNAPKITAQPETV